MNVATHRMLIIIVTAAICLSAGCTLTKQKSKQFTAPNYPRINLVAGYQVDPNWPQRPAGLEWGVVPGIAVDAQDRIWVINRGDVPVQIYSADGAYIRSWGKGMFEAIHQIRFDNEGNVWISDASLHTVRKFTPEGKLLLTLGIPDEAGEDENHLNRPTDMAIAPSGEVFVSDGYGNNRVVHFDSKGRFVKSWGKMGVGPGEFSMPHSIVMDSKGRLYVAGRNNVRIQVFDQDGSLLTQFSQVIVPWAIWITPQDEIYVCGSSPMRWGTGSALGTPPKDQMVIKFDTQGCIQELWTFPMSRTGKEKPGELNWVHGIAVDSSGNLYLGDIEGKRAQKFIRLPSGVEAEQSR